MFEFGKTDISGVKRITGPLQRDDRGSFLKLFHEDTFIAANLGGRFPEIYISTSRGGVIRGMHFQLPPHDHDKLVYCLDGKILDVVVDIRVGSPTYKTAIGIELDSARGEGIYIPRGCAHGFCVRSDYATMLYLVETVYAPASDAGIRWDSLDFDWPTKEPILSKRDTQFPSLVDFASPFSFGAYCKS